MCGNYSVTYVTGPVFGIKQREATDNDLTNLKKTLR